jgi:hypothetical protein
LEEIQIKPHTVINPSQALIGSSRIISVVAHQAAYYIAILLLYMTAIVLLVGTRPGEGNLLLTTIGVEALVDEFAAVVRVYASKEKGRLCRIRWTAVFTRC